MSGDKERRDRVAFQALNSPETTLWNCPTDSEMTRHEALGNLLKMQTCSLFVAGITLANVTPVGLAQKFSTWYAQGWRMGNLDKVDCTAAVQVQHCASFHKICCVS